MILLSDNDLVIKLAQCNLIDEALSTYGAEKKDCFVLNSFQYSLSLKNPDKSIKKYVGSVQAYDRIRELIEYCSILDEGPVDLDLIGHMGEISEIDPGEFALFLHARKNHSQSEAYKVLTGDKKALKAICRYDSFEAFDFLCGNIACLESTMIELVDAFGHAYINDRVVTAKDQVLVDKYDQVLRSAFGPGRDIVHCKECLTNYMSDITRLF